jgi:hypothetical protein
MPVSGTAIVMGDGEELGALEMAFLRVDSLSSVVPVDP